MTVCTMRALWHAFRLLRNLTPHNQFGVEKSTRSEAGAEWNATTEPGKDPSPRYHQHGCAGKSSIPVTKGLSSAPYGGTGLADLDAKLEKLSMDSRRSPQTARQGSRISRQISNDTVVSAAALSRFPAPIRSEARVAGDHPKSHMLQPLLNAFNSSSGDFLKRIWTKLHEYEKVVRPPNYRVCVRQINRYSRCALPIKSDAACVSGVAIYSRPKGTDTSRDEFGGRNVCASNRRNSGQRGVIQRAHDRRARSNATLSTGQEPAAAAAIADALTGIGAELGISAFAAAPAAAIFCLPKPASRAT